MRIFKNAWFQRFARREKITDDTLIAAVVSAEKGSIDAALGGHVIKQRIAKPGKGKSGGYRAILVFRKDDKAFFLFGFAKSQQDNITPAETAAFKKAATHLLALTDAQLEQLIAKGALVEIHR